MVETVKYLIKRFLERAEIDDHADLVHAVRIVNDLHDPVVPVQVFAITTILAERMSRAKPLFYTYSIHIPMVNSLTRRVKIAARVDKSLAIYG